MLAQLTGLCYCGRSPQTAAGPNSVDHMPKREIDLMVCSGGALKWLAVVNIMACRQMAFLGGLGE